MNETTILIGRIIKGQQGRAITNGQIVARLKGYGFTLGGNEGQKMREHIHALRVAGYPVCASGAGYFWGNKVQVEKFIEEFTRRVASQHKAIEGMRKGLMPPLLSNDAARQKEKLF